MCSLKKRASVQLICQALGRACQAEAKLIKSSSNRKIRKIILKSNTILWNGPVGVFEMSSFEDGTKAIGKAIADSTKNGAFSLVGGGDSVAAAKQFGFTDAMSYISTGGGAMLEMLEGKALPGIVAVQKQAK